MATSSGDKGGSQVLEHEEQRSLHREDWMDGWMDGPNMTFNQKTNDPVLCETKRYCYLNFMTG